MNAKFSVQWSNMKSMTIYLKWYFSDEFQSVWLNEYTICGGLENCYLIHDKEIHL